mmetsp:Transcript_16611/g.40914  ORF Transcript_16611/g.40914 Transcript_16611/m.40914 type:complete len:127 (-) Transcript_16611:289-669(-)
MAFPCNQINRQEPDSNEVIKEFVSKKYGLPDGLELFSKVDVNGPNSHPVFKHLKSIFPGDIFGYNIDKISCNSMLLQQFSGTSWDIFVSLEVQAKLRLKWILFCCSYWTKWRRVAPFSCIYIVWKC